jgi:hypothetical protein
MQEQKKQTSQDNSSMKDLSKSFTKQLKITENTKDKTQSAVLEKTFEEKLKIQDNKYEMTRGDTDVEYNTTSKNKTKELRKKQAIAHIKFNSSQQNGYLTAPAMKYSPITATSIDGDALKEIYKNRVKATRVNIELKEIISCTNVEEMSFLEEKSSHKALTIPSVGCPMSLKEHIKNDSLFWTYEKSQDLKNRPRALVVHACEAEMYKKHFGDLLQGKNIRLYSWTAKNAKEQEAYGFGLSRLACQFVGQMISSAKKVIECDVNIINISKAPKTLRERKDLQSGYDTDNEQKYGFQNTNYYSIGSGGAGLTKRKILKGGKQKWGKVSSVEENNSRPAEQLVVVDSSKAQYNPAFICSKEDADMTMKYQGAKGNKTIIKGKIDIPNFQMTDDKNGYMAKRKEFLEQLYNEEKQYKVLYKPMYTTDGKKIVETNRKVECMTIEQVVQDIFTRAGGDAKTEKDKAGNTKEVISALIVETIISTWKQKGKEIKQPVKPQYLEESAVSTDSESHDVGNTNNIQSTPIKKEKNSTENIKTIHKMSKKIDNNIFTSSDFSSQQHMKASSSLGSVISIRSQSVDFEKQQQQNTKNIAHRILSNPNVHKHVIDIKHGRSNTWTESIGSTNERKSLELIL